MQTYLPLLDAMVDLLAPLIEIVVHDLSTDKIAYIKGGLSTRRVGDSSNISMPELREELDVIQKPYSKISFDGRLFKSISVPIISNTAPTHIICINYDISLFSKMQTLTAALTNLNHMMPESLFKNDWQEKLQVGIYTFIQAQNWDPRALKTAQKKEIVAHLYQQGAFKEKKAADHVAKILNMGRATVFNYLREWKETK